MNREDFYTITTALIIILTVITIVFSSIVIVTIVLNWNSQYRSITNLLIGNSCAALLYYAIATIIAISFMTKTDPTEDGPVQATFCRLRASVFLGGCVSSGLSYFIQAISRYFITILYKHKILLTFRINWMLIFTSWFIGFIIPALMFISPVAYQYESESRMCLLTTKVFHTSFPPVVVIFCIPLNTIILLYGLILRQSTHQNQMNSNTFAILRMRRSLKVFRNILISVTILTVGGTPSFMLIIIHRMTDVPWQFYSLIILVMSFAATLNSLALFFINKQIRTLCYNTIRCQRRENRNQTLSGMAQINQTVPQSVQMLSLMK